jgi:hypothetical protein
VRVHNRPKSAVFTWIVKPATFPGRHERFVFFRRSRVDVSAAVFVGRSQDQVPSCRLERAPNVNDLLQPISYRDLAVDGFAVAVCRSGHAFVCTDALPHPEHKVRARAVHPGNGTS